MIKKLLLIGILGLSVVGCKTVNETHHHTHTYPEGAVVSQGNGRFDGLSKYQEANLILILHFLSQDRTDNERFEKEIRKLKTWWD